MTRVGPASFRFSIRMLLILVFAVSLGIASLRGATAVWASIMVLTALAMLCTASVGSVMIRGTERASWLGFAVYGWAYFLLCLSPWGGEYGLGPARFLTRAATAVLLQVDPDLVEMPVAAQEDFAEFTGTGKSRTSFHGSFHAMMSVLFAGMGAVVTRGVVASRLGRGDDPDDVSPRTRPL